MENAFWAAAAAIEMPVIVYHHLPKFGLTIGACCVAIMDAA